MILKCLNCDSENEDSASCCRTCGRATLYRPKDVAPKKSIFFRPLLLSKPAVKKQEHPDPNRDFSKLMHHLEMNAARRSSGTNKIVYWIAFPIAFAAFRIIFMKVHLEVILGVLIAGGICSLLPYFLYRKKSSNLAVIFVLVCLAAGVAGGAIIALPTALICTVIGYYKTKNMVTGSGNA